MVRGIHWVIIELFWSLKDILHIALWSWGLRIGFWLGKQEILGKVVEIWVLRVGKIQ